MAHGMVRGDGGATRRIAGVLAVASALSLGACSRLPHVGYWNLEEYGYADGQCFVSAQGLVWGDSLNPKRLLFEASGPIRLTMQQGGARLQLAAVPECTLQGQIPAAFAEGDELDVLVDRDDGRWLLRDVGPGATTFVERPDGSAATVTIGNSQAWATTVWTDDLLVFESYDQADDEYVIVDLSAGRGWSYSFAQESLFELEPGGTRVLDGKAVDVTVVAESAPSPRVEPSDVVAFVSERPSPLFRSAVIPHEVAFGGEARLSGRFEVIREAGWEEGDPAYFRVLLLPDAASREILPHEVADGPVRELWLRNTDDAMRALLSPAQIAAMDAGDVVRMTGDVVVRIHDYRTGVDCDTRGYNALLLEVESAPTKVAAAPASADIAGC